MAKVVSKKKNWYKGLTATAISLAMAGAAFSVPALAIDYDLANGSVNVETNTDGNVLSWQESETAIWNSSNKYNHSVEDADKTIHITQYEDNNNSVSITGDVSELDITIENSANDDSVDVTIDKDGNGTVISEDGITLSGNVDLTLDGDVSTEGTFIKIKDNDTTVTITGNSSDDTNPEIQADDHAVVVSGAENADVAINGVDIYTEAEAIDISNSTGNLVIENTNIDSDDTGIYIHNQSDVEVTLQNSDIDSNYGVFVNESDVTLEYSGTNTITASNTGIAVYGGSELTIENTDSDASLSIDSTSKGILVSSSTVEIGGENLTVDGSANTVLNDAGSVEIDGGTYYSQSGTVIKNQNGAETTIKDGTFNNGTANNLIANISSTLTIDDGTFNANQKVLQTYGTENSHAVVTINGGEFTNTSGYLAYLYEYGETYVYGGKFTGVNGFAVQHDINQETEDHKLNSYDTPVVLVWGKEGDTNGPEMVVSGAAVYNNYWRSPTDITINSGMIISTNGTAMYFPGQGNFTMNGGLIQGLTCIDAKMGNFTFNGGYIIATGANNLDSDGKWYEGGISGASGETGSALVFATEFYGSGNDNPGQSYWGSRPEGNVHFPENNDLTLTINDGVFISKYSAAITVYDWNRCDQNIIYNINGGRFSSLPKTYVMSATEDKLVDQYDYLIDTKKKYFAPSTYYDGVDLKDSNISDGEYGNYIDRLKALLLAIFSGKDAPYYASLADAIEDRDNDPDARAYIYYLLDNGLDQTGTIDRQTQIFYDKAITDTYLTDSVLEARDEEYFGYSFDPADVSFDNYAGANHVGQYVLTNYVKEGTNGTQGIALWSPAVFFNPNGGAFTGGNTGIYGGVLASTASGNFETGSYGNVSGETVSYMTYDELGDIIDLPAGTVLELPENPTREGYIFGGWYYADGTAFDPSNPVLANQMIYAKWIEITPPTPPYTPPYTPPAKDPVVPDEPVVEPDNPVVPDEPTPVSPSIPDEVIDDIIDEVEQLINVPKTGVEEETNDYAAAAVPAGVLALAVAGLLRRKRRAQ